ncbi:ABC transporter ATP-binding protein OS=Streptomyces glaucescens OX=1907 GN=SGLAU_28180 PE=4 SV=1 [Streptomyces glaucescens]
MDEATEGLVEGRPGADDAYAVSLERWLALGGADLDERAEEVAGSLGLGVGLDQPMTSLSGGQAARAGLASLLLSRYDVFLLDEPTNDLDLDGLERLERFVGGLRAGTVVVSHDREFLTRTVTKVLELDPVQRQINLYGGGYAAYLEEREVARLARPRRLRGVRRQAGRSPGPCPDAARLDGQGRENARRKAAGDNDKIVAPQRGQREAGREGPPDPRMIERLDVVEEPRKRRGSCARGDRRSAARPAAVSRRGPG